MNLFLFCLPLAVPSTFRPKRPPERGLRSGFTSLSVAFLQIVRPTGSALTLAARSWSLMRLGQRWPQGKRSRGLFEGDRHLPPTPWRQGDSSIVSDGLDRYYKLISVNERGARDLFVNLRACCGTSAFLVLTLSPRAPPYRTPALGLVQMWRYIFLCKFHRKLRRAVRTPGEVTTFYSGDLRDACSPNGCYQVVRPGEWR